MHRLATVSIVTLTLLRRRRVKVSIALQKKKSDSLPTATASSTYILWDIALGANKVVGIIAMMVCAYKWSAYLATLHENHFWFSEIKVKHS